MENIVYFGNSANNNENQILMTNLSVNILDVLLIIGGSSTIIWFLVRWLANITANKVLEQQKHQNNLILEDIKAFKQNNLDSLLRKKEVYENLINAMRIFLIGNDNNLSAKKQFMKCYDLCFLWAPDNILELLNSLIDLLENRDRRHNEIKQVEIKQLYQKIILELRKDAGFSDPTNPEYHFFSIN